MFSNNLQDLNKFILVLKKYKNNNDCYQNIKELLQSFLLIDSPIVEDTIECLFIENCLLYKSSYLIYIFNELFTETNL